GVVCGELVVVGADVDDAVGDGGGGVDGGAGGCAPQWCARLGRAAAVGGAGCVERVELAVVGADVDDAVGDGGRGGDGGAGGCGPQWRAGFRCADAASGSVRVE